MICIKPGPGPLFMLHFHTCEAFLRQVRHRTKEMREAKASKMSEQQKKDPFVVVDQKKTVQWFEDFLDTYQQHDKNGCITKKEEIR